MSLMLCYPCISQQTRIKTHELNQELATMAGHTANNRKSSQQQ